MDKELILLRFIEIERNIRDIQNDIVEIKFTISSIDNSVDDLKRNIDIELDKEISSITTTITEYKDKFNRLESRLYDIGRLFRDTFASSFSKK
jgi:peptidoglycan hydrolase CwlO-like protein